MKDVSLVLIQTPTYEPEQITPQWWTFAVTLTMLLDMATSIEAIIEFKHPLYLTRTEH